MNWLFPWFIQFACLLGSGEIVTGVAGPYPTEEAAIVMGVYLRHEGMCETGAISQRIFWTDATPIQPIHYRHWKNLFVHDREAIESLGLKWKEIEP